MAARETATGSIRSATYSGVPVWEMMVRNVLVMRRKADSFLNATQLLKIAGIDKGHRTKILEKDIATGVHEKVQGGYGKYQGTWVPFDRGVEIAQEYSVIQLIQPILDFDPSTYSAPEKSNSSQRAGSLVSATHFHHNQQQIRRSDIVATSPKTGRAKADVASTRIRRVGSGSPEVRSTARSINKSPSAIKATASHTPDILDSNTYVNMAPQLSQAAPQSYGQEQLLQYNDVSKSLLPENSHFISPEYTSQQKQVHYLQPDGSDADGTGHQTFKRQKLDDQLLPPSFLPNIPISVYSMPSTPYFPSIPLQTQQSYQQQQQHSQQTFTNERAFGTTSQSEPNRYGNLLVAIFLTDDVGAIPDILVSPTPPADLNLDLVIDDQGNTPLHWAAALARINILDILILRGASIGSVNRGGETALMRAVLVTNNYDQKTFPALLDVLLTSIAHGDNKSRTVIHHIALTAGLDLPGRADTAAYYLACLVEHVTVRHGINFFSTFIDIQDNNGDTAVNIAARIGASRLVSMLIEVGANTQIPNNVGLSVDDFPQREAVDPSTITIAASFAPVPPQAIIFGINSNEDPINSDNLNLSAAVSGKEEKTIENSSSPLTSTGIVHSIRAPTDDIDPPYISSSLIRGVLGNATDSLDEEYREQIAKHNVAGVATKRQLSEVLTRLKAKQADVARLKATAASTKTLEKKISNVRTAMNLLQTHLETSSPPLQTALDITLDNDVMDIDPSSALPYASTSDQLIHNNMQLQNLLQYLAGTSQLDHQLDVCRTLVARYADVKVSDMDAQLPQLLEAARLDRGTGIEALTRAAASATAQYKDRGGHLHTSNTHNDQTAA